MNFTIIIHTGALVFTIKSYTGVKSLNGLVVKVFFVVGGGIAVAWNVLCDGIFICKSSVCITIYCQNGERSMTYYCQEVVVTDAADDDCDARDVSTRIRSLSSSAIVSAMSF